MKEIERIKRILTRLCEESGHEPYNFYSNVSAFSSCVEEMKKMGVLDEFRDQVRSTFLDILQKLDPYPQNIEEEELVENLYGNQSVFNWSTFYQLNKLLFTGLKNTGILRENMKEIMDKMNDFFVKEKIVMLSWYLKSIDVAVYHNHEEDLDQIIADALGGSMTVDFLEALIRIGYAKDHLGELVKRNDLKEFNTWGGHSYFNLFCMLLDKIEYRDFSINQVNEIIFSIESFKDIQKLEKVEVFRTLVNKLDEHGLVGTFRKQLADEYIAIEMSGPIRVRNFDIVEHISQLMDEIATILRRDLIFK